MKEYQLLGILERLDRDSGLDADACMRRFRAILAQYWPSGGAPIELTVNGNSNELVGVYHPRFKHSFYTFNPPKRDTRLEVGKRGSHEGNC